VLVDLGVSKVIPAVVKKAADEDRNTYFFSTREITRLEHQVFLRRIVPLEWLVESLFPDHDLYALGVTLEAVCKLPSISRVLERELGRTGFEALNLLVGRLRGPKDQQFATASQVAYALRKLDPEFIAPMGLPELSIATNIERSVTLPGLRLRVTEQMLSVVNSPYLQRLRDVHQLSFIYLHYPGGRHSRLTHSLESYAVTREYIAHLLDDAHWRLQMMSSDLRAALLYALLRNVGHFALSHIFEELQQEAPGAAGKARILGSADILKAFTLPEEMLERKLKPIAALLRAEGAKRFPRVPYLSALIKEEFDTETHERLRCLITGNYRDQAAKMLGGLFDSPIDVFKIAYLRLDSAMTGIDFGKGIDLDSLLASLRSPSAKELEADGPAIAIQQKGLSSAESAILARYWMTQRVYWHHSNRSMSAMAKFTLEALLSIGVFEFEDYLRNNISASPESAVLYLNSLWDAHDSDLKERFGPDVVNPCARISYGHPGIYTGLISLSRKSQGIDGEIYNHMQFRGTSSYRKLLRQELASAFPELEICPGEVWVDFPAKRQEDAGGKLWVYWHEKRTPAQGIFDCSPLLRNYVDEFETYAKHGRIFFCPTYFWRP